MDNKYSANRDALYCEVHGQSTSHMNVMTQKVVKVCSLRLETSGDQQDATIATVITKYSNVRIKMGICYHLHQITSRLTTLVVKGKDYFCFWYCYHTTPNLL
jgi:hypothetical protein